MKRACLLVDHPLRDLEGMVLVAAHLALRGVEVFVVPMYQKHETWALRPDFVLLNYLRHAHQRFLSTCLSAGIRVGVLDTEGGVRNDFDTFAGQVAPMLPGVSLYCVWGGVQRQVLAEVARRYRVPVVETGCPRYDFATAPWSAALQARPETSEPMVLVNTNFPVVNSRFQSEEHEIRELLKFGWSEEVARGRSRQTRIAREEMLRVVEELSEQCGEAQIVVRPHPFEDAAGYRHAFSRLDNVCVSQEGSVFEWIARARVLVHHNCSTAIEAVMMGVEPIVIDWLDTPLLTQPATVAVSHRAASRDALVASVRVALAGHRLQPSGEMQQVRDGIIADFFHATDGRASERVAAAILDALGDDDARVSDARYALLVCTAEGGIPARAYRAATLTLGNGISRAVRDLVRPSRTDPAKKFGVADVAAILARLRRVHGPFADVSVSGTLRQHTIAGLTGGELSVRVAAA